MKTTSTYEISNAFRTFRSTGPEGWPHRLTQDRNRRWAFGCQAVKGRNQTYIQVARAQLFVSLFGAVDGKARQFFLRCASSAVCVAGGRLQ